MADSADKKNEVAAVIKGLTALQDMIVAKASRDAEAFKELIANAKEAQVASGQTGYTLGNFILDAIEAQTKLAEGYAKLLLRKKPE